MKNYIVKVLRYFKDLEEKKDRFVGDEFETTKERYEFLKSKDAVELVKIFEIEKTEYSTLIDKEPTIIETMVTNEIVEEKEQSQEDEVVEQIITKKKRKSSKK